MKNLYIFLALFVLVVFARRSEEGEQGEDVPNQKAVTDKQMCSEGEFYSTVANDCMMCSECPENLIVLRVCSDRSDTSCGPFTNFKFKSSKDSGTYTVLKNDKEDEEEMTPKTTKASQVELVQSGTWYTISLVLLGILSILFLFLTVFVVVTCYVCKHRRQDKESYSYNSVASEVRFRANEQTTDERYIRDPTTPRHIPARERLKPSIEAGGEDSAGPSHVLVPPPGDREASGPDPDPDNSAQSGSAEYVYIKKVKVMHASQFDVV